MLIPRHRITISVKFISHFSGKTTHCHSEELKLVFVNSCQGILGGKMLFVFHGASVRIHSCLTSIVLKKRNRKPFEKRLDYGDRAARLSGTAAWVCRRDPSPRRLLIVRPFASLHCTINWSSFLPDIMT